MKRDDDDQRSSEDTDQRLRKTLHAAFNMKPTPLKAIPKKHRASRGKRASRPARKSA